MQALSDTEKSFPCIRQHSLSKSGFGFLHSTSKVEFPLLLCPSDRRQQRKLSHETPLSLAGKGIDAMEIKMAERAFRAAPTTGEG